jgi:hypothetical protein
MISRVTSDQLHLWRAASWVVLVLGCMSPAPLWASDPADLGLVTRALANELRAAQDSGHPMQYRLRKSTPRLTSTKLIIETRDGAVARLLTVNGSELSAADREKDEARLKALLSDPNRQRKRKQTEQDDTGRVLKVLRALPRAFLFQYAGSQTNGSITLARFNFSPNPKFNSADLELLVLTAMSGTLTIDASHERVLRLDGRLQQDVDIGWGILGRLNKGGWLTIEQADIGAGVYRITRFQMDMTGRVFFKTKSFNTVEEESGYLPVPPDLTYQEAIQLLHAPQASPEPGGK